MIRRVA